MTKKKYRAGDIVELAGIEFVVLENLGARQNDGENDALFIMALKAQGESIYGECANYTRSELREAAEEWLGRLVTILIDDYGIDDPAIYRRRIDLTTLDGYAGYGAAIDVSAAPLTLDEARRYAEVIPAPDKDCWLATGWGTPEHLSAMYALLVRSDGGWGSGDCSGPCGVRPALVISSSLLSSADDGEEDAPEDALKDISADALLEEVRRRMGAADMIHTRADRIRAMSDEELAWKEERDG